MLRKIGYGFLVVCVLVALALGGALWLQQRALEQELPLSEAQLLEVAPGSTPGQQFLELERKGLIDSAFWLRLYWRLHHAETSLYAGEYALTPGMRMQDLLKLWLNRDVVQYQLTLVEGWSFRQLRANLEAAPKLTQTLAGMTDEHIMAQLGYPDMHPEGRFFPDTYQYTKGVTDLDILKRAFARLERILQEEWAARAKNLPYDTPYQALIMASIIEKETGVPEERDQIAGVFVRRLDKKMLLQTDPTVIYGLGEHYNGQLNRTHLRTPTPYNTYTQSGLPPTPIAMPGRAAIWAALHPAAGASLYFVAKGDGSHVFSDTLEQHNQAVRQYQLSRRADYRSSPAPRSVESEPSE